MSSNRVRDRITADIKRAGRSVICVGGGMGRPPFAYTIGNALRVTKAGEPLPELLIIGTLHGQILNPLSQLMIRADQPFAHGELVRLPGALLPVKAIRASASARTDYTIQAGRYFGRNDYPVMQILLPDSSGKYPDQPGCQPPFAGVPVLAAGTSIAA